MIHYCVANMPGGVPRTSTLALTNATLPYALQLCPRSVILDDGGVVADGPTRDLLADPALLARHRLELPFGFSLNP